MITFSMGQVEPSDEEFQVDSDDSVEDDEETIDQAEKEDADDGGESHANELKQLEAEMDMPLDKLLAKYNQPAAGHDQPNDNNQDAEDVQVEDNADEWSDSEGVPSYPDTTAD